MFVKNEKQKFGRRVGLLTHNPAQNLHLQTNLLNQPVIYQLYQSCHKHNINFCSTKYFFVLMLCYSNKVHYIIVVANMLTLKKIFGEGSKLINIKYFILFKYTKFILFFPNLNSSYLFYKKPFC